MRMLRSASAPQPAGRPGRSRSCGDRRRRSPRRRGRPSEALHRQQEPSCVQAWSADPCHDITRTGEERLHRQRSVGRDRFDQRHLEPSDTLRLRSAARVLPGVVHPPDTAGRVLGRLGEPSHGSRPRDEQTVRVRGGEVRVLARLQRQLAVQRREQDAVRPHTLRPRRTTASGPEAAWPWQLSSSEPAPKTAGS